MTQSKIPSELNWKKAYNEKAVVIRQFQGQTQTERYCHKKIKFKLLSFNSRLFFKFVKF